jgi:hypothetical protein
MQHYRAYFVGPQIHFVGYRLFVCEDDGEAIEKAKEIFEGPTIELWSGPRLVTRIIGQKKWGRVSWRPLSFLARPGGRSPPVAAASSGR